ncbi:DUF998 domain-containing protein [Erythrobacter longus]|uniref:DUF998 domain-containing protein n=1 Tax=Erythrobacter longus TaxID=1044 RepID=UPI001268CBDE|nr:DUF998 domain-containing protein [Erythrobacter longus]
MTRPLISAGFLPLPVWLIFVTVAGFMTPGYSAIESHASVMTLGEGWSLWITNSAAIISGAALIVFGVGTWGASGRIVSGGAFCWIIFGISMIANGIWPMGSPMHGLYAIGIINILGPALTLLECDREALRKRMIGFTVFCSLMGVLYLWVILVGLDPEGYTGLTQRIFGSINFLWPLVFAYQSMKKDTAFAKV